MRMLLPRAKPLLPTITPINPRLPDEEGDPDDPVIPDDSEAEDVDICGGMSDNVGNWNG